MSSTPPEREKPLTFNPSVDDKAQLRGFLTGVYQQYLEQRTPSPENSSDVEDGEVPTAAAASKEGDSATGHHYQHGNLKQVAAFPTSARNKPAQSLEDHPRVATSEKSGKRTRRPSSPSSKQRREKNTDPSSPDSCAAAEKSSGKRVNYALIEKQLNVIARASLLRANTINLNAPDPEYEAPPNETPVQKRRRLERINGRRKRARKLIEMDSLNERLTRLVDRNKKLKAENGDLRQKIDAIKEVNSNDGDLTKILEIVSEGCTAAAVESAAAQVHQSIAQIQIPPVSNSLEQTTQLPPGLSPHHQAQALLPQQQHQQQQHQHTRASPLTFDMPGQQQQHLYALLGNNQLSSLAISRQQPLRWGNDQLLLFPNQPLQYQRQQTLLPILSATSGLYAGLPSNLQVSTLPIPGATLLSQPPRPQVQAAAAAAAAAAVGTDSTTAVEEKQSSPERRAGTPPPKTVKELKAWMKKHRDNK